MSTSLSLSPPVPMAVPKLVPLVAEVSPMREVVKCRNTHCGLTQFMTANRGCRRCKAWLDPVPEVRLGPMLVVAPGPTGATTGQIIKRRRTQGGLSQTQLAMKMGTTRTYISKVENGRCSPMQPSLMRFAAALECDFLELVGAQQRILADVDDPELVVFMRAIFDDVKNLTHAQLWLVCKEARRLLVQRELPSIPEECVCITAKQG